MAIGTAYAKAKIIDHDATAKSIIKPLAQRRFGVIGRAYLGLFYLSMSR
jgi:hypothetical protein